VFFSIINVLYLGCIYIIKYRILQIIFFRLILRLLIYGIIISITDRFCNIYLYYITEAIVLIVLPKHSIIGKRFIQILSTFNYYALGIKGVHIIYGTNCNVK